MPSPIVSAINEEHRTIAGLLDIIEQQTELFAKAETPDLELLHLVMEYTQAYPDLYHHPKEDLVFKRLKERAPELAGKIDTLLEEHARMPEVTRKFATLVEEVIEDATMSRDHFVHAAREYVDVQRRHMVIENDEIAPAVTAHLTPEDWREIESQAAQASDPIVGSHERYRRLSELILAN